MKKIILAFSFLAFAVSCSNNQKKTDDVTIDYSNAEKDYAENAKPAAEETPAVDPTDGKALIESNDCLGCHKADSKLIGPSYKDVAAKYTDADIQTLAKKIIDGGSGNWGEVPMTPHPGVSMDKAEAMVKYILSVK